MAAVIYDGHGVDPEDGVEASVGSDVQLELAVWREVGRHIDIEESVERLGPVLMRALPIDAVIVRRIDVTHGRLDTVATAARRPAPPASALRTECSAADMDELLAWSRAGRVVVSSRRSKVSVPAAVVPDGALGEVIAGPLVDGDEPLGILVLPVTPSRPISREDRALVQVLLEPFAAALANDRRLHELARLREAVEAENRALLSRLSRHDIVDSIVGNESGLRGVMERVDQVAPTDVPVLILGETGSGKEVVARAIHARSRRAQGPIVRVNCGAIPTELVDSELFGHERGSFTGAVSGRKGWFERADGGTLFLDEIGELPLAAQVRLLRVIQDGTLERVGGQRAMTVDVRIVAATHRDLHTMVEARTFREDLWYRISVFPIRLPPLRERREDIAALAAHFAMRAGQRLGGAALVPSRSDLELLLAYSWPGNVRELNAVIERAAILGDGRRLDVATALGSSGRPPGSVPPPPPLEPKHSSSAEVSTLDDAMVDHIQRALSKTRGRIEGKGGAADLLGINPHTLRARMRKLGIAWNRFRATAGE